MHAKGSKNINPLLALTCISLIKRGSKGAVANFPHRGFSDTVSIFEYHSSNNMHF